VLSHNNLLSFACETLEFRFYSDFKARHIFAPVSGEDAASTGSMGGTRSAHGAWLVPLRPLRLESVSPC
jgi:hypothetical protein